MKILYRISDGGNAKAKLHFVYDKKRMFLHFIKIFRNHDIYVFADNVCEDTYQFLKQNYDENRIFRISLGNAASFMHTLNFAIQNFDENDKIYFAEDDYVYINGASEIIEEGLTLAPYSSGYDHPDKYVNHSEGGPNPFIEKGGENTRVMISTNSHWKLTNSCCMTFASTLYIMKQDYEIFQKHCEGRDPGDFGIFCDLYKKDRTVVSCIPGVSTHGELQWLTKFVDWEKAFIESLNM
jgi:hypothetical protein